MVYSCLEAFAVDDGRAGLVVFGLGDPHLLEGGETTLIFMVEGARAVSSLVMRSPMPWNIVVPPDNTTFAYRSLRISTSHFMMDWKVVSWIPEASLPTKLGWKSTS